MTAHTITPAPVRRSIRVDAPLQHAFDVFTAKIGSWWPRSHKLGPAELDTVIIEPRVGGRWFERDVDGSECEIGKVLVWEPPNRLVLAWQLSAEWKYDRELITEVDVRFIAEGKDLTLVELEHRNLERFGERAEAMRAQVDAPDGWRGVLQLFADFAKQTTKQPK